MQLSYIHRRIVVTIRTHSEPQYCFIKLWADVVCLSITQNDDVIDMLLKENEKNTEKKGNKRGRKIFASGSTLGITFLNITLNTPHKNSTRASAWRSYFFSTTSRSDGDPKVIFLRQRVPREYLYR